jgi:hypothetical protein
LAKKYPASTVIDMVDSGENRENLTGNSFCNKKSFNLKKERGMNKIGTHF